MSLLNSLAPMRHYIKLYVPSTTDVDAELSDDAAQALRNVVVSCFSTWFGGATCYPAQGGWQAQSGDVVYEDVTIVQSYMASVDDEMVDNVIRLAQRVKEDFGQEAVALELDNSLYFV